MHGIPHAFIQVPSRPYGISKTLNLIFSCPIYLNHRLASTPNTRSHHFSDPSDWPGLSARNATTKVGFASHRGGLHVHMAWNLSFRTHYVTDLSLVVPAPCSPPWNILSERRCGIQGRFFLEKSVGPDLPVSPKGVGFVTRVPELGQITW